MLKVALVFKVTNMIIISVLMIMFSVYMSPHTVSAHKVSLYSPYRFDDPCATIKIKDTADSGVWINAIDSWNKTHAFKFIRTTSSSAQIKADSFASMNSQYRNITGITYSSTDAAAQLISANVRLNLGTLNKYHYTNTQRKNVAEHELGHSLGLLHNPSTKSVMYYRNRYVGIQPIDVAAVKNDYANIRFDTVFSTKPVKKTFIEPVNNKTRNSLLNVNVLRSSLILANQTTHAEYTYLVK